MLDVLHVIPFLWSGAGKVLVHLCRLQAPQLRLGIVTSEVVGDQRDWSDYRAALRQIGVPHTRIDLFSREPGIFWPAAAALAELIDAERPRVVHTHAGVPAAAAAVARTLSAHRFRSVAQFYSWGLGRPTWMNRMDLWGFRQADRVVCSADAYRRVLVAGGVPPRRITMVPWGVEQTSGRSRPAGVARRGPGPVIGFVGRIEPRKRQLDLVRLAAGLVPRFQELRLELVGPVADRAYAADIEELIERKALGTHVRLCGKVADPLRWMSRWDAFVSLSSDEGQGMAVLEAMELGTPVAAAMAPGIEDFLPGHGLPLDPGAALRRTTAAIGDLLGDPAALARLSRNGRAFVHRRFAWQVTTDRLSALYLR